VRSSLRTVSHACAVRLQRQESTTPAVHGRAAHPGSRVSLPKLIKVAGSLPRPGRRAEIAGGKPPLLACWPP
jgi:hypothetical protein